MDKKEERGVIFNKKRKENPTLRKRFEIQMELGAVPIEEIKIPTKSRDELPPVLLGLQHIYIRPELNEKVFEVLEEKIPIYDKGRAGLSLWEILVLGVVRLTLDVNYDRLEHIANYDSIVRELMGVKSTGFGKIKEYSLTALKENVSRIDEEILERINEIVVKEGHYIKKKEGEKLRVKVDSYVLESTVHFPTDINLLYDSGRKVVKTLEKIIKEVPIKGWRKKGYWIKKLKNTCRKLGQISKRGGQQKEKRLKEEARAYINLGREIIAKVETSKEEILRQPISAQIIAIIEEMRYYEEMLIKHIDLVERRLIKGEKIPHDEKIFSIFETYTEWIQKGKSGNRVELGLKVGISTDQYGFILGHRVMEKQEDVQTALPIIKKIKEQYRDIESVSFDKGFWSPKNKEEIEKIVTTVVMPKKGKKNKEEHIRESEKEFKQLRKQHSAVESNINSLEHHGLNRCPDKGIRNFRRYTALGVLSYNLHLLGKFLNEKWNIKRCSNRAA